MTVGSRTLHGQMGWTGGWRCPSPENTDGGTAGVGLVGNNGPCDKDHDGGGGQMSPVASWPENGGKRALTPLGAAMSPAAIATTAVEVGGIKKPVVE